MIRLHTAHCLGRGFRRDALLRVRRPVCCGQAVTVLRGALCPGL